MKMIIFILKSITAKFAYNHTLRIKLIFFFKKGKFKIDFQSLLTTSLTDKKIETEKEVSEK